MKNLCFNEDSFELNLVTNDSKTKASWQNLFTKKPFVIAFQPGAGNPAAAKDMDNWLKQGLGGCTNEALELGDSLEDFYSHNIDVYIVNSLEPDQQKEIIKTKKFNDKLKFISDPEFDLADLMGVEKIQANGTMVHKPIIGIYSQAGKCLKTLHPENMGCSLAKRIPINTILQLCKEGLGLSDKNDSIPEKNLSIGMKSF